jgi:RNA polymerase subunit RPABC4/transcription elongation factor Spt4
MDTPKKQIPPERKALYYGGMALIGIGLLLFLSTFFTFMANFGNFDNFEGRAQSEGARALGGMVLMVIGGFMMNVGARGWAGSGVVLDPEQARKDVEPWSRMGGGIVQDALSEVEVVKKLENRLDSPEPQIKARCQKCQTLNDETAKFCNQCGAAI